jgi:hypothetical protein
MFHCRRTNPSAAYRCHLELGAITMVQTVRGVSEPFMFTYYFHLRFATFPIADEEGSQLADLGEAKLEAGRIVRELAASSLKSRREFNLISVQIHDRRGTMLAEVMAADAISEVIKPDSFEAPKPD